MRLERIKPNNFEVGMTILYVENNYPTKLGITNVDKKDEGRILWVGVSDSMEDFRRVYNPYVYRNEKYFAVIEDEEEEWREIVQTEQPLISDGYTAVSVKEGHDGVWLVKGPGPVDKTVSKVKDMLTGICEEILDESSRGLSDKYVSSIFGEISEMEHAMNEMGRIDYDYYTNGVSKAKRELNNL